MRKRPSLLMCNTFSHGNSLRHLTSKSGEFPFTAFGDDTSMPVSFTGENNRKPPSSSMCSRRPDMGQVVHRFRHGRIKEVLFDGQTSFSARLSGSTQLYRRKSFIVQRFIVQFFHVPKLENSSLPPATLGCTWNANVKHLRSLVRTRS